MNENAWLAARFEADRPRLRVVAYRMLGSVPEAEDAVQEAWRRVTRADVTAVEDMSGWLTTIVAHVSLNMLQSRSSRREDLVDRPPEEAAHHPDRARAPQEEVPLAESVGAAMHLILGTLTPAERLAFVLHDLFAMPFEEIAPILDCTPATARQLAGRARLRFQRQGINPQTAAAPAPKSVPVPDKDPDGPHSDKADFIHAFLAASREGDFEALLSILAPDINVRADRTARRMEVATAMGVPEEIRGPDAVTRAFANLSWAPVPALINGSAGLAHVRGGVPQAVLQFDVTGGKISGIEIQADLTGLDIIVLC